MNNESDFDGVIKFAADIQNYKRTGSTAIVLLCIRNLRILTTQFPAFGVLFETIRRAKSDLFFFFVVR